MKWMFAFWVGTLLLISCSTLSPQGTAKLDDNNSPYRSAPANDVVVKPNIVTSGNSSANNDEPAVKPVDYSNNKKSSPAEPVVKPQPVANTSAQTVVKPQKEEAVPPVSKPQPVASTIPGSTIKSEQFEVVESIWDEGKYYIIVGTFKSIDNARKVKNELINEGYLPAILVTKDNSYRVAMAAFLDETKARTQMASIKASADKYAGVWLLMKEF